MKQLILNIVRDFLLNMTSFMETGLKVVYGVIALIIAAAAIATTNSATVGAIAWVVLGFVTTLMGVKILQSFSGKS